MVKCPAAKNGVLGLYPPRTRPMHLEQFRPRPMTPVAAGAVPVLGFVQESLEGSLVGA